MSSKFKVQGLSSSAKATEDKRFILLRRGFHLRQGYGGQAGGQEVQGSPSPRFTFHVSRNTQHTTRSDALTLRRSHASTLPRAFTLIEILVTITLLSFIVLGLLIMFNQVQRAFKAGMMQTDVLENGRAVMDMVIRDLEQTTPAHGPDWPSNVPIKQQLHTMNFYAAPDAVFGGGDPVPALPPLLQYIPGTTPTVGPPLRTNFTQHFFFLQQLNQDWIGTGYQVVRDDPNSPVGSLYRFSSTNAPRGVPSYLFYNMYNITARTFNPPYDRTVYGIYSGMTSNRVADGVVHLAVRAFSKSGLPLIPGIAGAQPDPRSRFWGQQYAGQLGSTNTLTTNTTINAFGVAASSPWGSPFFAPWEEFDYIFASNAVPAYVELELGILEPKVFQRYKSIGLGTVAGRNYLSNNIAQVHLFRQRIPIRNVDFTAYP